MKRAGSFYVPDAEEVQIEALAAGGWQLDHLEAGLKHVQRWGVAVDGGAHVGSWTATMLKRFKTVHAFEPDPTNFQCLQANMKGCDNVIRHNVGLGDRPMYAEMEDDERWRERGNTGGRYIVGKTRGGTIPVVTLDSLNLDGLDFLKLDIEGFELFALTGAEKTIMKYRPVVMIEDKPRMATRFGLTKHAAQDYLSAKGMRFLEKVGSDYVWGWDDAGRSEDGIHRP